MLRTVILSLGFSLIATASAEPAPEITVERQRVDGQWRVVCTAAHPSTSEEAQALGEKLKKRCKREADTFGSRQHLTSGALLRARVGPVEADEKKTTLTVNVDLVAG